MTPKNRRRWRALAKQFFASEVTRDLDRHITTTILEPQMSRDPDPRHVSTDFGFWPELPHPYISDQERRLLPANVAEMERRNAEAQAKLDAALKAAHDPSWKRDNPQEYAIVLAYLNNPDRTEGYRGSSTCRVCGHRPNGSQDWFKGPFRYPQGYVHYLVEHDFKPPQAVIQEALRT